MPIHPFIRGFMLTGLLGFMVANDKPVEAFAADTKDANPGAGTAWGDFMTVGKVIAEVRSSDGDSLRMRVYWNTIAQGKTGSTNRGRRPTLHGNHGRTAHNPLMMAKAAMTQAKQVQVKTEHHDYDVGFFPDTMVKGAPKAQGGATTLAGDLSPGTIIEAWLIRKKSIQPRDVQESDLKLKAVAVIGFNPAYKADKDDKKVAPAAPKTAK